MSTPAFAAIQAQRQRCWDHGFRPMAVYSWNFKEPPPPPGKKPKNRAGKAPLGNGWHKGARQTPPECITLATVVAWGLNSGLLCDGLRAIDLDMDEQPLVALVHLLAVDMLGVTIRRIRNNSPRSLLVYRASAGEPPKRVITGASHSTDHACKIEVLGKGQQFVAYGRHPSGAELQWPHGGPADIALADIPAVTEDQITAFLTAAAAIIDAKPPEAVRSAEYQPFTGGMTGELADIAAALDVIPNAGPAEWNAWVAMGLRIFAATDGSDAGRKLWLTWSAKNTTAHDGDAALERWDHFKESKPDHTGASVLFKLAHKASPGWRKPSAVTAGGESISGNSGAHVSNEGAGGGSGGGSGEGGTGGNGREPPPEWNTDTGPDGEEPPPRRSEDDDFVLPIEFSENALSYLFSARHQDRLVYVHGWGKWLRYHAGRWHEDHAIRVYDAARAICAEQGERALHTLPARYASKIAAIINKAGCIAAIERLARHHEPQTRDLDLFDADQSVVGTPSRPSKLQRKRKE